MEDQTFESSEDRSLQSMTPSSFELETSQVLELEDAAAVPDRSDAATLSDPAPGIEEPGEAWRPDLRTTSAGPGSFDACATAGELTRGRRRDLESGATSLKRVDTLKIVYWGPGRSGKTTNLQWLHAHLRPELRGRLVSLDGPGERTLYFDCLPLGFVEPGGASVQLRLFTVPGQPRFRLTRKLVLDGVDGIVFVWDSRSRRLNANLASLMEMRETMVEMGVSWSEIPRIIQYNKQDLPDGIPPEQLDHVLDRMGERVTRVSAVARQGTGVLETLSNIAGGTARASQSRNEALPGFRRRDSETG